MAKKAPAKKGGPLLPGVSEKHFKAASTAIIVACLASSAVLKLSPPVLGAYQASPLAPLLSPAFAAAYGAYTSVVSFVAVGVRAVIAALLHLSSTVVPVISSSITIGVQSAVALLAATWAYLLKTPFTIAAICTDVAASLASAATTLVALASPALSSAAAVVAYPASILAPALAPILAAVAALVAAVASKVLAVLAVLASPLAAAFAAASAAVSPLVAACVAAVANVGAALKLPAIAGSTVSAISTGAGASFGMLDAASSALLSFARSLFGAVVAKVVALSLAAISGFSTLSTATLTNVPLAINAIVSLVGSLLTLVVGLVQTAAAFAAAQCKALILAMRSLVPV